MTWTVQRRIAAGFAAVLFLVMSVAVIGAVALTQASDAYELALSHERQIVNAALEAEIQTDQAVIESNRFLLSPREEFAAARERALTESRVLLERSANLAASPEQQALWREALAALSSWDQSALAAMDAARDGDLPAAVDIWESTALPQRQQMSGVIDAGLDLARSEAADRVTQAAQTAEGRRIALLIATALALLGGLASGVLLNRAVSGPLRETTTVLASSASEILAATGQQASSAAQTSSAVVETSTTVDEVTQTAEQAAQRARTLSSSAQRAAEIGQSGRQAVDDSISSMKDVKERVESIADSILVLANQAQAIGEIIATVNDIADQTNILALNAAVEAARAGEHGRGFAVVAGEVRNLAEESKSATVQVRQILGEIQRATSTAVIATERGTHEVAAGTRQVEAAGETIRMLSEAVDDAAQAAAQIVASAGQQATGMTQIRQAMGSIQQASRQNLASTRQAEQAARDLNDLGRKLLRLVGAEGAAHPRAPSV